MKTRRDVKQFPSRRRVDRQVRQPKPTTKKAAQVYVYRWNRMERKGEQCLVVARGRMNSCLVQFTRDGFMAVTSRNALKRAS